MSEARELLERFSQKLWNRMIGANRSGDTISGGVLCEVGAALDDALKLATQPQPEPGAVPRTFQDRVHDWMLECFGSAITGDTTERNRRFLEEALELVQANGCTAADAHWLVDYVFARPVGELRQEVGGVMVTLAALCNAAKDGVCIDDCAEAELARVWGKIAKIREKQAAKPEPGAVPELPEWLWHEEGDEWCITDVEGYDSYYRLPKHPDDLDRIAEACTTLAARERARRAGS